MRHATHSVIRTRLPASRLLLACVLAALWLPMNAQIVLPPDPDSQANKAPAGPPANPVSPALQGLPWSAPASGMLPSQGVAQPPLSEILGEATLAPPREIRRLPPVWPYYLLASLIGLLLLCALIVWIVRRNRRPRVIPIIPADVQALNALEALRPLIQEARAREFSYQASEIIRDYLEDRFDLRARNRTTREFLNQSLAETQGISTPHRDALQQFLQFCDLAKFARHILTPEQLEAMYQSASHFIRETRPSIMATLPTQNPSAKRKEVSPSS